MVARGGAITPEQAEAAARAIEESQQNLERAKSLHELNEEFKAIDMYLQGRSLPTEPQHVYGVFDRVTGNFKSVSDMYPLIDLETSKIKIITIPGTEKGPFLHQGR